ncbi:MAG: formylglycine-generating enzyme family protein [Prevotellaceae bacterium]|jgi:formylglycine-generating enzyme required for sulfatase activity|nr:formylglycine-generating enzyme family protein [Prevotellaceae bacterium]
MKKVLISLLALLLLAAQAQAQREPLAVLVVGVDNWMFGDVIAHIVGEELRRDNSNLVPVTREKFVQNKLKELRRTGAANSAGIIAWAKAQGLAQVCLVEAKKNGDAPFSFTNAQQTYSAQLISAANCLLYCSDEFTFKRTAGAAGTEISSAELTKVAWEVVGRLRSSSCKPSAYIKCHPFEPEMVFVEGGEFTMGCLNGRDGSSCKTGSGVTSSVTLSPFWIGKYEITQSEWAAVMGVTFEDWVKTVGEGKTFHGIGDRYPVYYIGYNDALAFISALNTRTGKSYRLPTEAEWDYAARGGKATPNCTGGCEYSGSDTAWHVAWYSDNSGEISHEVGTPKTQTNGGTSSPVDGGNELGIHDMSGNVFEWCSDWYGSSLPGGQNPSGPSSGLYRVLRGGNWNNTVDRSRIFPRVVGVIQSHEKTIGFRVVLPGFGVVSP